MLSKLFKPLKTRCFFPSVGKLTTLSYTLGHTQAYRQLDSATLAPEIISQNEANMYELLDDYYGKLDRIVLGGSQNARTKHQTSGKNRKLLVRDRISRLIDDGSPFLELGTFAGYDLYTGDEPNYDEYVAACGGIVTGIGIIHGKECMIIANDATVKGGVYWPITVKKHLRAQEIATQCHIPCVYLVDSGGANLPYQADVFPDKEHFGRIFYNQATMSSQGIPQISCVMGLCTAGGAYVPAMSDHSIMVKDQAAIFLGGPQLVYAATGESISAENLGGSIVHCEESGVADYFAENDIHALEIVRNVIENLNLNNRKYKLNTHLKINKNFKKPKDDMNNILNHIPKDMSKTQMDIREIILRLTDNSKFDEFKKYFGQTLVTGFAEIYGMPVGIIANNGVLFSESAQKGSHFIELCCQSKTPLLFFQNITGFMVGKDVERQGIAKHGAKLVMSVACANVPKITILCGGSYGAGNYGMCGRAYSPTFLYSWVNNRTAVMGGEQAATVLSLVHNKETTKDPNKKWSDEEREKFKDEIREKYVKESSAYYGSARLWDDNIIDPRDTRKVVGLSLSACLNKEIEDTKFGVFRM